MSIFTERLRAERQRMGLTQAYVAQYIGTSVQNYSAFETKREPSYAMLCKLANLYDVSVDYLLGRTKDRDDINAILDLATSFYEDQLDEMEKKYKDPQIRDRAKQIMKAELMLQTNILFAEDFIDKPIHDYYISANDYCQLFEDIIRTLCEIIRIEGIFISKYEESEENSEYSFSFKVREEANEMFRNKLADIVRLITKYNDHKMDLLAYEISERNSRGS